MLLTVQQKFILDVLKKLGCVRQEQIRTLVQGSFPETGFEITQARINAMLRQLRTGTADVRLDDALVWLDNQQPDCRRLEAIDVMIELTEGRPQQFSTKVEPPVLLRFAYGGNRLRLFTVASLDGTRLEQCGKERIVWVSDSGEVPEGLALPPRQFFAARQPDGTHRFYGSNGP